jgi:hypothetical protein
MQTTITIAGVTLPISKCKSLVSQSPLKNQTKKRSLNGLNVEILTKSYTHRYILNLQNLTDYEYKALYASMLNLDGTTGKMDVQMVGEARAGIVHIPNATIIPDTLYFEFDISELNPDPQANYTNVSIPLSVYVAV